MKKNIALVITLAAGMLGTYAMAAPQTFTGKLTDNMCPTKHMMPGKSEADCVRECVNDGGYYVLVSGTKTVKVAGDQRRFSDLAGRRVRVSGELKGDTLTVSSIAAAN